MTVLHGGSTFVDSLLPVEVPCGGLGMEHK